MKRKIKQVKTEIKKPVKNSIDKELFYEVKVIKVINWPLLHKAIYKKFGRDYVYEYLQNVWKGRLNSVKMKTFLDECLGKPLDK